jgi:hypothetical protein
VTDGTAESYASGFAGILAERGQAEIDERQRTIRRAAVGVAVLLLHVIALGVFVYSSRIPLIARIRTTAPEAILWIPIPHHQTPPAKKIVVPPAPEEIQPDEAVPQIIAPITLPPPVRPRPAAPPANDGLLGVGRSLACGASTYENLSPAQREQCIRHPWRFVKRPDGTIVLDAPPKPIEPPPTAADIMRHEQETAPPCPVLQNVPCLGRVLHGDPLGGQPQPF